MRKTKSDLLHSSVSHKIERMKKKNTNGRIKSERKTTPLDALHKHTHAKESPFLRKILLLHLYLKRSKANKFFKEPKEFKKNTHTQILCEIVVFEKIAVHLHVPSVQAHECMFFFLFYFCFVSHLIFYLMMNCCGNK